MSGLLFVRTLAIVLVLGATPAIAQIGGSGTIKGTVSDPTGAVIPGAAVTATNIATGVETARLATDAGLYVIAPLPAGTYRLTASAAGFRPLVHEQVVVDALTTLEMDLKLEVGTTTESVTITAAPPELNTADARMGQTVRNEMYTALPLSMGNGNPAIRPPLSISCRACRKAAPLALSTAAKASQRTCTSRGCRSPTPSGRAKAVRCSTRSRSSPSSSFRWRPAASRWSLTGKARRTTRSSPARTSSTARPTSISATLCSTPAAFSHPRVRNRIRTSSASRSAGPSSGIAFSFSAPTMLTAIAWRPTIALLPCRPRRCGPAISVNCL